MFDANLGGFLAVIAVIIVTPGPDMLLMARHTLGAGRRAGLATGYGVCTGVVVHAIAAAFGLSAILASSAQAFTVVKVAGALYLIFLGASAAWGAVAGTDTQEVHSDEATPTDTWHLFRQGMITNVLNPKIAILFLSVLPQFVDRAGAVLSQTLFLSAVFLGLALIWVTGYVSVLTSVGTQVLTPRVRRWIEGISGLVLVALGLRLLGSGSD